MTTIPFKVTDADRDIRTGLTANSMAELIDRVRYKFSIDPDTPIKIVLEQDGTEIDDNDYFITLEPDTALMVLCHQERWTPYKSMMSLGLPLDTDCDNVLERNGSNSCGSTPTSPVEELVWRLHQDLSLFPWLTTKELETIAGMDTDEMRKIVSDGKFLEFLQDLSERYLQDKKESKSISSSGYNSNSSTDSSAGSNTSFSPKAVANGAVLHDPIKLIRMYSKSNHYVHNPKNGYNSPDSHHHHQAEPKAFRSQ